MTTIDELDEFELAYIHCALWCMDDDAGPGDWLENGRDADMMPKLAPEAVATMVADCKRFRDDPRTVELIDGLEDPAGHDFWLTRNGHGVGFWDRDSYADRDYLDERAKTFREVDLYEGDDGKLYHFPA